LAGCDIGKVASSVEGAAGHPSGVIESLRGDNGSFSLVLLPWWCDLPGTDGYVGGASTRDTWSHMESVDMRKKREAMRLDEQRIARVALSTFTLPHPVKHIIRILLASSVSRRRSAV
jgi:hypothetical protein